MTSVTITDLKAHLSRYLQMVRRGSEIQVTDRGVPVARIVGLAGAADHENNLRVERLAERGVLRRGSGDLRWVLNEPAILTDSAEIGSALVGDREDRA